MSALVTVSRYMPRLVKPADGSPPGGLETTANPDAPDGTKPAAPAPAPTAWPLPPATTRPLSDIREITEPSLMDMSSRLAHARLQDHPRSVSRADTGRYERAMQHSGSVKRGEGVRRQGSVKRSQSLATRGTAARAPDEGDAGYDAVSSSSYPSTPELSGCFAVPMAKVPRRSSSFGHSRLSSREHAPDPLAVLPSAHNGGHSIPNRGHGRSPVKDVRSRLDPVTAGADRRMPSRTQVRVPHPVDILDAPSYKHPRLKLGLQVSAPLSVGGGTIEGHVKLTVDDNERLKQRRTLGIGAVSVDLLGYEEVSGGRQATFLALGTELVDAQHPPPPNMVEPANPLTPGDGFWSASPSASALPFLISLPLDTGPPPFSSKHASIRFLLCATVLIRDGGTHYRVRTAQDVHILPTYDPEKALTALPSPLTATDELVLPKTAGFERIRLTAGLHRQVWVSGSTIFADIHVLNKTHKHVKKIDLSLERDILCYKHAAAATRQRGAGHARVCESNHQSVIASTCLRAGVGGWAGVELHASDTRTCDLEVPRGHATVRCGKYFEVRYFLTVTLSLSTARPVSVQLPIILVHMNSLDVVPNSVAQVAAAIEEKRAREDLHHQRRRSSDSRTPHHGPRRHRSTSSPPARAKDVVRRQRSYTQGRAFAAPRQQSLDRQRAAQADLDILRATLDTSPRKLRPRPPQGPSLRKTGSTSSVFAASLRAGESPGRGLAFSTTPQQQRQTRAPAPTTMTSDSRAAEGIASIRARMRRMASFETLQRKPSTPGSAFAPWHENTAPPAPPQFTHGRAHRSGSRVGRPQAARAAAHSSERSAIAPHVLGLPSLPRQPGFEVLGFSGAASQQRPATAQGFRERFDRSRFEFKAVRRKASGGLRGKGVGWWENLRSKTKGEEHEGWI
ncbi:hypothetical protein LTR53_009483 [Teratosphaeriaceae sp. CCFEE 6253]|nr:hypothetical protein LTR53_009483 [Teratosphaeriaceae sp. CCFEE 6253]